MQGYQFPAVLLQSPSVLSVVQGTLFHPALRGGISLILALVTAPADGFIRSPLGNVIVIVPLAQLGQGKNKCTVAWLGDLGGFVLNIVLVPNHTLLQQKTIRNDKIRADPWLIQFASLPFTVSAGTKAGAGFGEQLWIQTALRSTFSLPLKFLLVCLKPFYDHLHPLITFPCNTCATADLPIKTTPRKVCMT